jgi:hypothetical protein
MKTSQPVQVNMNPERWLWLMGYLCPEHACLDLIQRLGTAVLEACRDKWFNYPVGIVLTAAEWTTLVGIIHRAWPTGPQEPVILSQIAQAIQDAMNDLQLGKVNPGAN